MRIEYVKVGGDVRLWQEYATDVLGAKCRKSGDELDIVIDEYSNIRIDPSSDEDLAAIGWRVESADELFQIEKSLKALNLEFMATNSKANSEIVEISIQGPDSIRHEIKVESSSFVGGSEKFLNEHDSKFVAGKLGVGHMAVASGNSRDVLNFYEEVLCLKVSDYIDFDFGGDIVRVVFMRCNSRHHSIALIPMDMDKKLNHLMLEYRSIDELGRRYDSAKKSNYKIVTGLGRHTNDKMISFYQQSPSGFDIECGYGGLLVGDDAWDIQVYDKAAIWGHENFRN